MALDAALTGSRWLAATAVGYGLLHHAGGALASLGSVGLTRWADWVELVTPYAVLLPAAAALAAAGAGRRSWTVYLVGAVTYAVGAGIHLAANSIANVAPGPAAHLWDETIGHYVWHSGTVLVFIALASAFADRDRPRGPGPHALALLVGGTHATNALEGGTAVLGLLVAVGFVVWGWRRRSRLGRLLLVGYAPALLAIAVYGAWHGGFPQPSHLP